MKKYRSSLNKRNTLHFVYNVEVRDKYNNNIIAIGQALGEDIEKIIVHCLRSSTCVNIVGYEPHYDLALSSTLYKDILDQYNKYELDLFI